MNALTPASPPSLILLLGAHSDDIEIGCGGAVLHLARRYPAARIVWAVFSGDVQRAREARRSAADFTRGRAALIVTESFRDGFFPAQFEQLKTRFELLKAEVQPDLIFTHRGDDAHQDHRAISQLTWNTFRNHMILEYEIPKWDGDLGTPNIFVPVNKQDAQKKTRLLMKHFGTQRSKHWFTADTFAALMRIRGLECASPSGLAEGFYGRKLTLA